MVVLGLRERDGTFSFEGINNVKKVRKELFDGLGNRQKVSANLLVDSDVAELILSEGTLLVIQIPRANRKQRPIFLKGNPLGNTFLRLNEGDRCLPDEDVKRMLAEQVEDSRDDRILPGYGTQDLCMESFRAYRQVFANREPLHPWNAHDDLDFLRQIGGWRQDREDGDCGLTLAGLLMFGWMTIIQEALPNYMLDYQERSDASSDSRWVDRVTLDGKWSGNLYDFYRKVYLKLTEELKVPFSLTMGERKDETSVHVAIREALANVLVHADYTDRATVLVVKRPDMLGFRNPGLMRIPPDIAIRGGEHDCRNRTLHKMFRFVGVGEQAGSGIPKIYGGWADQHWRPPALYERMEPYNQTLLALRMVDLLPDDLMAGLRSRFGVRFAGLQRHQRLVLAAAATERTVTHARVIEITGLHPVDATRMLRSMMKEGFLEGHNPGRGAVYCLPGAALPRPEEVFGDASARLDHLESRSEHSGQSSEHLSLSSEHLGQSSEHLAPSSEHLSQSSEHLAPSSEHLPGSSEHFEAEQFAESKRNQRDKNGLLRSGHLAAPIIDSLDHLVPMFRAALEEMAALPRTRKKVDKDEMKDIIVRLCTGHYVTGPSLATLIERDPDALRQQYLRPLVREGRLQFAFPTTPTHAMQAYQATQLALEDMGTME